MNSDISNIKNESINKDDISQEQIPAIEMSYRMIKRLGIIVFPIAVIFGLTKGMSAFNAVVLAGVVLAINLVIMAEFSRLVMSISQSLFMLSVMGGFIIRLSVIFLVALIVRNISVIDFKVWLLSVAIGHVALFAWETIYVSLSLAHKDVKTDVATTSARVED